MSRTKTKKLSLHKNDYNVKDTMSTRTFNLVLGGFILGGLLLNVIMSLLFSDFFANMNPILLAIGSLIAGIIGIVIMAKSKSTPGAISGYTILCIALGALVADTVIYYDTDVILKAIIATSIVTGLMIAISYLFPNFFLSLGKTLFISLICMLIAQIILILIYGQLPDWILILSVGVFSLFIGYDWQKAQAKPKTMKNAIWAAGDLYLDIINIFFDLLDLLDN